MHVKNMIVPIIGEDDLHDIMSEIITAKVRFYAIGRALGLPLT